MGIHRPSPQELDWKCARIVHLRDRMRLDWPVIAIRLGYKNESFVKKLYWRHAPKENRDAQV
jgi:hypothetical protein